MCVLDGDCIAGALLESLHRVTDICCILDEIMINYPIAREYNWKFKVFDWRFVQLHL